MVSEPKTYRKLRGRKTENRRGCTLGIRTEYNRPKGEDKMMTKWALTPHLQDYINHVEDSKR
jgi:hypothetical protein